ncbi:MAG: hypothetical protein M3270_05095 [Thermoproteota archaeon]|nr:hypothetical protein [Thermoproteota archaeon]
MQYTHMIHILEPRLSELLLTPVFKVSIMPIASISIKRSIKNDSRSWKIQPFGGGIEE